MITADKLRLLTNMPAAMLSMGIQQAGHKKDSFTKAQFLGLTNGNQFCYSATYIEDNKEQTCKVFLTYDPAADSVTVDY
jgi:hypothetical protein